MFNAVSVLNRSLESIARQDLPRDEVEIVLVDDGSTDGSGNEARRLLDAYGLDAVFITRENGGVSRARNSGIEASSGDYLFFLDADDELPADFIRHVRREAFGGEPDLLWMWAIQKNRQAVLRRSHPLEHFSRGKECLACYLRDPRDARVIVGRGFLNSNRIRYREGIAYGEDVDFFIRLLFRAATVRVSRDLIYFHFRHEGQVTRTIDPIRAKENMVTIYDALLTELAGSGMDRDLPELLRLRKAEIVIKLLMMYRKRGNPEAFSALMKAQDTCELLRLTLSRGLSPKWKVRALMSLYRRSCLLRREKRV